MNDTVSSIIQGTFEIELIKIELKKQDICITGKGIIYQKDEELHLKLFNDVHISEESKLEELVQAVNQPDKTRILTEADCYILIGEDKNRNVYKCKVLLPCVASEVITEKLFSDLIKIKNTEENKTINLVEVYVNDNGPIPLNDAKTIRSTYSRSEGQIIDVLEDAWFFTVSDKYKIQVQRNSNYQKISIGSNYNITDDEIGKVLDSLRFVFGRYFNWFYINCNSSIKEKYNIRRSVSKNTIFKPPLRINRNNNTNNYETLFNCYYSYLSKESKEAKNLNIFVRKTIIAGYAYLGAFELVLATSIEGLLKIFPIKQNIGENYAEKLGKDIEKVSVFLKETFEEGNEVRNRVGGVLKSVRTNLSNNKDIKYILKELVVTNKLEDEHRINFNNFRNSKVHPNILNVDTVERIDANKRINKLNEMVNLFYHLIFLHIGYTGKFTNYFTDEGEDFTLRYTN